MWYGKNEDEEDNLESKIKKILKKETEKNEEVRLTANYYHDDED